MQQGLEITALVLTILATAIGLVRLMVIQPLDKKLEAHTDKMMLQIERRFLDGITSRMEAIEVTAHARSNQALLWAKALHTSLTKGGLDCPDPELYRWEYHRQDGN